MHKHGSASAIALCVRAVSILGNAAGEGDRFAQRLAAQRRSAADDRGGAELILRPVAGVLVDRFGRKRIMIASDVVWAALVLLIPLLLPFGVAWLYVLIALSQCANQL